jgi:hypothetical protein
MSIFEAFLHKKTAPALAPRLSRVDSDPLEPTRACKGVGLGPRQHSRLKNNLSES